MSDIISQLITWFFGYVLTWQFFVGYVACIIIPMPFLSNAFLKLWSSLGAWFVSIENKANTDFTNLVQSKISTLSPMVTPTNLATLDKTPTSVGLLSGHTVTTVVTTIVSTSNTIANSSTINH